MRCGGLKNDWTPCVETRFETVEEKNLLMKMQAKRCSTLPLLILRLLSVLCLLLAPLGFVERSSFPLARSLPRLIS